MSAAMLLLLKLGDLLLDLHANLLLLLILRHCAGEPDLGVAVQAAVSTEPAVA